MGSDMVRDTLGPWTLYKAPEDDENHQLMFYINSTSAFIGLLFVAIGLYTGGSRILITIVGLISIMMAGFAYIRHTMATQSKSEDDLGGDDGGPPDA